MMLEMVITQPVPLTINIIFNAAAILCAADILLQVILPKGLNGHYLSHLLLWGLHFSGESYGLRRANPEVHNFPQKNATHSRRWDR